MNALREKNARVQDGCFLRDKTEHEEVAQVIFWREEPEIITEEKNKEYLFRVGITGSSGSATYALPSLFVDEDNKLRDFLGKQAIGADKQALLCDLQKELSDKGVEQYLKKLDDNIDKIYSVNKKEEEEGQYAYYLGLVEYAVVKYLSTALYRYFFPFLFKKDIQRISNGIYVFVHSMKAARVSPFVVGYSVERNSSFKSAMKDKIVEAVIEVIPSTLEEVLGGFEEREVFYRVVVQHSDLTLKKQSYRSDKETRDMSCDLFLFSSPSLKL